MIYFIRFHTSLHCEMEPVLFELFIVPIPNLELPYLILPQGNKISEYPANYRNCLDYSSCEGAAAIQAAPTFLPTMERNNDDLLICDYAWIISGPRLVRPTRPID